MDDPSCGEKAGQRRETSLERILDNLNSSQNVHEEVILEGGADDASSQE
jgi:hypothetical protein